MAEKPDDVGYWKATQKLTYITLGIWFFFSFVVHIFAPALNGIKLFGFPLGYYMAAQGSLIAFVILVFWFCASQEKLDRDFGVSED
jgi:putative solute:sodium symporter small subunit